MANQMCVFGVGRTALECTSGGQKHFRPNRKCKYVGNRRYELAATDFDFPYIMGSIKWQIISPNDKSL